MYTGQTGLLPACTSVDYVVHDIGYLVRTLLGMDVAREDKVDLVLYKPGIEHDPYRLHLHVVVVVAIVQRGVHEHDKPWCHDAIHSRELCLQPLVLWRVLAVDGVGCENDNVHQDACLTEY